MYGYKFKKEIAEFQSELDRLAEPKKREWWDRYLKGVRPFRGVGIPVIRNQIKIWVMESGINNRPLNDQLELALTFISEKYAEDKLAGILYLQLFLIDQFKCHELLPHFESLYKNCYINDWNICDWFCVRILGPLIKQSGHACAKTVSKRRKADNLWQARSSVVAFVNLSSDSSWYPLIRNSCVELIHRRERFAKTAVGWILREIHPHDKEFVFDMIKEQLQYFSVESLKNALKNEKKEVVSIYVRRLKSVGK